MTRAIRLVGAAALLLALATPAPALAAPVAVPNLPPDGLEVDPPPDVTAAAWILFDDTYDLVLSEEDADARRPMASTTKMMTALLAIEARTPDLMVEVSDAATEAGEAEIGLVPGEMVPLSALVTSLVVRSANDSAIAIAEAVSGSVDAFVADMNERAVELGLDNTRFVNPHGLHANGHYSSARDLLDMARAAMAEPEFARDAVVRAYRFPPAPDGTTRVAEATNLLLADYEGAIGVKTGFTSQAGLVLVAAAEREGRRLYAVVMGSEGENANFTDAESLLDYGFESFGVIPLVVEGESYGLRRLGDESSPVLAAGTLHAFVHLAAAGVLAPQVRLDEGTPVLVVPRTEETVPVAQPPEDDLPAPRDAFSWFWNLFRDEE